MYTLSLHAALPICTPGRWRAFREPPHSARSWMRQCCRISFTIHFSCRFAALPLLGVTATDGQRTEENPKRHSTAALQDAGALSGSHLTPQGPGVRQRCRISFTIHFSCRFAALPLLGVTATDAQCTLFPSTPLFRSALQDAGALSGSHLTPQGPGCGSAAESLSRFTLVAG